MVGLPIAELCGRTDCRHTGRSSRGCRFTLFAYALALGLSAAGCLPSTQSSPPSVLAARWRPQPIAPGANDVLMNVIFVERPFGDPVLNTNLWEQADEDQLEISLRRALQARGFRVAVLGGQLPASLKRLFSEERVGQMNGEYVQTPAGRPTQIHTSEVHDNWPGETDKADHQAADYVAAVGSLRVIPSIAVDASVELGITPEIQHGLAGRRFVPASESRGPLDWTMQLGRQIRSFDDLMFSLRLQGGQYAMLSCQPKERDSLGSRFFTHVEDGRTVQRVVLIQADPSPVAAVRHTMP